MVTRQELLKYADTLYELKNNEVVKTYLKAQHEVVTYFHSQEENVVKSLEYYKSSKKYDYYIELPYEKFEVLANGNTDLDNITLVIVVKALVNIKIGV